MLVRQPPVSGHRSIVSTQSVTLASQPAPRHAYSESTPSISRFGACSCHSCVCVWQEMAGLPRNAHIWTAAFPWLRTREQAPEVQVGSTLGQAETFAPPESQPSQTCSCETRVPGRPTVTRGWGRGTAWGRQARPEPSFERSRVAFLSLRASRVRPAGRVRIYRSSSVAAHRKRTHPRGLSAHFRASKSQRRGTRTLELEVPSCV
ncbi:hypothetical protein GY45DRAFT_733166 [Cubamyces sp. BRFM 1775]|nr:hypothetical protein GY45DRAFT_733166 [Cubamyces sp. BRFM 1775]